MKCRMFKREIRIQEVNVRHLINEMKMRREEEVIENGDCKEMEVDTFSNV